MSQDKSRTTTGRITVPERQWLTIVTALTMLVGVSTADGAETTSITDKTLVVWTAPADLNQGGGSALTIDDMKTHFDGIIFAELASKRWMAGSDFHRRTEKQQETHAVETAGPREFVQIAIVYQGKDVTLYRNGEIYAEFTMKDAPQAFGPQSVVLMGKRHIDVNDTKHFSGAIDDARLYGTALDEKAIRGLRPNEPGEPEPVAWWTFENGSASDQMGRFGDALLIGGARIWDGELVLDGKTGTMIAAPGGKLPAWLLQQSKSRGDESLANASREMRQNLLTDRHRPGYHFVIPEGRCMPFDPNGAVYFKGRYHLFYIFQDDRGHNWGHVSSRDLFHWRHHPTGLVSGMFSGNCFINKDGRPTMCYHQVGQGNAMAVALDDELNEWEKLESNPITPLTEPGDPDHGKYRSWDPYGWLEDDAYYAIFGGQRPAIAKSDSLGGEWKYVGDLMANTVEGVAIDEDVSCADFFKLGDRRMLLCISHRLGCRYYFGDWKNEQFHPTFHEKMSWVDNSFFAPESLLDDRGRRIMWAWIFDGSGFNTRMDYGWSGTMSLPRVLSLGTDGSLRMNPPEEIETLRYNPEKRTNLVIEADSEVAVEGIGGNSIELLMEMIAKDATQFGLKVCCSPDGLEQTLIYYDAVEKTLKVDTNKSSVSEGPKSIEAGPLVLKAEEPLKLRVFVDKSVVEVFANGRQAVMRRVYPSRADSVGVTIFSNGGAANVATFEAWEMMPSNPY